MNKLKLLIITMCLMNSFYSLKAQSYSDAVTINLGMVQNGGGGLLSYNYIIDRYNNYIILGVFGSYSQRNYIEKIVIPYEEFSVNLGFSKNIVNDDFSNYCINISAGGIFGYESINGGEKDLSNGAELLNESRFIYGAFAGAEVMYNFSEKYSILANATEFYHSNSNLGKFMPFINLGFRYYIN